MSPDPSGADALAMLARVIEVGSDPDALFTRFLDLVVEATAADTGFVIFSDEQGEMRFRSGHNITADKANAKNPELSYGAVKRVLKTGLPFVAGPSQTSRAGTGSVQALRIRWILCVPIPHEGRVAGVVYLDQRGKGPGFTETHLKLLRQFSGRIGQVMMDTVRRGPAGTEPVQRSLTKLRGQHAFEGMIGPSAPMQQVFARLRAAAAGDGPLVIWGETGTGRHTAAAAVERLADRPRSIVVSLQPPDGGEAVELPPLRRRPDDLPHLLEHFLAAAGSRPPRLEEGVMDALLSYGWPGNVAELEAEARRMAARGRDRITLEDLPAWIRGSGPSEGALADRVGAYERAQIVEELRLRGRDVEATAKALGLSTRALRKRMKELKID